MEQKGKLRQIRSTHTQAEKAEIEIKAKEYRLQGKSDEEAERLATEEVRKLGEENDEAFNVFVKQVKLYDVMDDLLRRAAIGFEKEYNESFPGEKLALNLRLKKLDKDNKVAKGIIWKVQLVLEMRRKGVNTVLINKNLSFRHVAQIRDEAGWKFALYEAMFQELVKGGLLHVLGKIKIQEANGGE